MMIYPHRIRLRSPWECERAGRPVDVPFRAIDLGLGRVQESVRLTRAFGYPGRIDEDERVWLTFGDIRGMASIRLNQHTLGERVSGACEFEVTALLKPHNRLEVLLDLHGEDSGLTGEVAMEVRRTAYLKEVKLVREADGKPYVCGTVAGECDGPLELYVLVDNRNAAYQMAAPGHAFRIPLEVAGRVVRVELVNVSLLWYFVELT